MRYETFLKLVNDNDNESLYIKSSKYYDVINEKIYDDIINKFEPFITHSFNTSYAMFKCNRIKNNNYIAYNPNVVNYEKNKVLYYKALIHEICHYTNYCYDNMDYYKFINMINNSQKLYKEETITELMTYLLFKNEKWNKELFKNVTSHRKNYINKPLNEFFTKTKFKDWYNEAKLKYKYMLSFKSY